MIPTALAVAQALMAACKETGEDPVACIRGVPGVTFKAQHYAMWALLASYPGLKAHSAARMVTGGDKSQAAAFYSNSRNQSIPGRRPGGGGWWTAETYTRVVAVVEAARNTAAMPVPKEPGDECSFPDCLCIKYCAVQIGVRIRDRKSED